MPHGSSWLQNAVNVLNNGVMSMTIIILHSHCDLVLLVMCGIVALIFVAYHWWNCTNVHVFSVYFVRDCNFWQHAHAENTSSHFSLSGVSLLLCTITTRKRMLPILCRIKRVLISAPKMPHKYNKDQSFSYSNALIRNASQFPNSTMGTSSNCIACNRGDKQQYPPNGLLLLQA